MEQLKPQTRLDYYVLTHAERSLLRAMCAYSTEGAAFIHSIPVLAQRASMDERHARRLLRGYTRKDGTKSIGLIPRGIVTISAPANPVLERPATLTIRWEAMTIDPGKQHILERRMQLALPLTGKQAAVAEEEAAKADGSEHSPEQASRRVNESMQKPANSGVFIRDRGPQTARVSPVGVGPPGDTVSPGWGHDARSPGTRCPDPGGMMSPDIQVFSGESSVSKHSFSGHQQREVVDFAAHGETAVFENPFPRVPKAKGSAWDRLHPGLYRKLEHQLQLISETRIGLNTYGWNPEEIAKDEAQVILRACADTRPAIWDHVAKELAGETYEAVLERERRREVSPDELRVRKERKRWAAGAPGRSGGEFDS